MELKRFDSKKITFTANGVEYVITEQLSIRRWREYEKVQPYLTFGIGFDELFKAIKTAYDFNNKTDRNAVAVQLHNIMAGIKDAETEVRYPVALRMCALVINRKDEDPGAYDPNLMMQKMNDWEQEGFAMGDFFTFALNIIKGFRETYVEYIKQQAAILSKSDLMQS